MPAKLEALLPLEPLEPLEWFVGNCLCAGHVWDSPRISDGVVDIVRGLERGPDRLHVRGQIWAIEQTRHAFWLELVRDGDGDRFAWFLYFDVAEASARRAQSALDSHERAEDIPWRASLAGEATVEAGALAIVPGSTRVLLRDMPEHEPSGDRNRRRPRRG